MMGGLIGTMGFPIVAYLLLYFRLEKILVKHTEVLNELCILLRSRKEWEKIKIEKI